MSKRAPETTISSPLSAAPAKKASELRLACVCLNRDELTEWADAVADRIGEGGVMPLVAFSVRLDFGEIAGRSAEVGIPSQSLPAL